MGDKNQKIDLDLRGTVCPMAFVKLRLLADSMPTGALVRVLYEDKAANEPLARSTASVGHRVVSDEPNSENAVRDSSSGMEVGLKLMTVRIGG